MLAAVLKDFNQLALEDVPKPEPGPGEVQVRIKSCGICATDYKAIKGIRKNVEFPLIPGHEPAGVIAALGPFVHNVKEGDEVIISPSGFCGVCRNCRLGMTHYCEHAYTTGGDGYDVRPGSFAEYTVTGGNNIYPKPANLSFDAACQGEPVSGAWERACSLLADSPGGRRGGDWHGRHWHVLPHGSESRWGRPSGCR